MDAIKEGMLASAKAAESAARIGEKLFCQNTPNVMNFNSQICTTREQSERLLKLGIKKETADMALHFSYMDVDGNEYYIPYTIGHQCTGIPAWSLHRLIEMALRDVLICGISFTFNEDVYEKVIRIIEHQIKGGYFPKEYLI